MNHIHIQTNGFGVYPSMMHPKRETINFIAEPSQLFTGQTASFSDEGGLNEYSEYTVTVNEERPARMAENGKYQGCENPHHVQAKFTKTGAKLTMKEINERLGIIQ